MHVLAHLFIWILVLSRNAEILIARVYRGHLGRHRAKKALKQRQMMEKQARFHYFARLIQTRYRGTTQSESIIATAPLNMVILQCLYRLSKRHIAIYIYIYRHVCPSRLS